MAKKQPGLQLSKMPLSFSTASLGTIHPQQIYNEGNNMKEWVLLLTLSAGSEQPPQQTLFSGFQSQEKCVSAASKIGTHAVNDRKKMLEDLKQSLESPPEPLVRFTCTEIDK